MDYAESVKSTRRRKCLGQNVLPSTHEFDSSTQPILDLERLRRLAIVARPLRERVDSTDRPPLEHPGEGSRAAESEPRAEDRPVAGTHRGARDAR